MTKPVFDKTAIKKRIEWLRWLDLVKIAKNESEKRKR